MHRVFLISALIPILLRLRWENVIEGQIGKQNFVAHMIESLASGSTERGFPLRFFFEPWHPGVIPWAEEFPLYHLVSAALTHFSGLGAVQAGRAASAIAAVLILLGVYRMILILTPGEKTRAAIGAGLAVWTPGLQIYGSSVIPDTAMVAMMVWACVSWLQGKKFMAYGFLGIACLFKYFAVFTLAAFVFADWFELQKSRAKIRKYLKPVSIAGIVAIPTILYLVFFIVQDIPNPVTEYRANGYGHLAGPFILQTKFYVRYLTWVFVKAPSLPLGLLAIVGAILFFRDRTQSDLIKKAGLLFGLMFLFLTVFALTFASSFFVHDYYALPFLIPILFFGLFGLRSIKNNQIQAAVILVIAVFGWQMSSGALVRAEHYIPAADSVRKSFQQVPDRSRDQLLLFVTDTSQPPIPILSRKTGWSFVLTRWEDQNSFWKIRMQDPRLSGVVLYMMDSNSELAKPWAESLKSAGWTPKPVEAFDHHQLLVFSKIP
jgi:hypothetical protein